MIGVRCRIRGFGHLDSFETLPILASASRQKKPSTHTHMLDRHQSTPSLSWSFNSPSPSGLFILTESAVPAAFNSRRTTETVEIRASGPILVGIDSLPAPKGHVSNIDEVLFPIGRLGFASRRQAAACHTSKVLVTSTSRRGAHTQVGTADGSRKLPAWTARTSLNRRIAQRAVHSGQRHAEQFCDLSKRDIR